MKAEVVVVVTMTVVKSTHAKPPKLFRNETHVCFLVFRAIFFCGQCCSLLSGKGANETCLATEPKRFCQNCLDSAPPREKMRNVDDNEK